jgi:hypothetical protein
MGDVFDPIQDPMNEYWRVEFGQPGRTPQDIVGMPRPKLPPQKENELKEMARLIQVVLQLTPTFTKHPAYLQPPLASYTIDTYKNTERALPFGVPTEIVRIVVPKGGLLVLRRFANLLESPAAFDDVTWSFQVDQQDIQIPTEWYDGAVAKENTYVGFQEQLGRIEEPYEFTMPILVGEERQFRVVATNNNIAITHDARVRLTGWLYIPAKTSTQRDEPTSLLM